MLFTLWIEQLVNRFGPTLESRILLLIAGRQPNPEESTKRCYKVLFLTGQLYSAVIRMLHKT